MNDRLYPAAGNAVNERDRLVAIFLAEFADQPDLADVTPAARRVLATAAALFHQRGAVDTSVRDVTRACGLSPGALYNHFASKDELLFAVVKHGHVRMRRRIDRAIARTDRTPAASLRAFVRAYVAGHVEHPEFAQMVRREYVHLSGDAYDEIVTMRRATRRRLTRILVTGQRGGHFTLLGGEDGAVAQALMVLDMCSRTSDWFDRSRDSDPSAIITRYEWGALRLVGARAD